MNQESYGEISIAKDYQAFLFVSNGTQGQIFKCVIFTPTDMPNIYNMSLGDVRSDGQLDVSAVTNNGDRNKVLATIVKIVTLYTNKYPDRSIYFKGTNEARTRLYRIAIGLYLEHLSKIFEIKSRANASAPFIHFQKDKPVTDFLIKKKFI